MKMVTLLTEGGKYIGYGALIHEDTVDIKTATRVAMDRMIARYGQEFRCEYCIGDVLAELRDMGVEFELCDVDEMDI